jgi:hypothetical protein
MEPANSLQMQVERNESGQFVKGQSGNPAGRAPGSRNQATMLAQQLFDGAAGPLANKAVELALGGNAGVLRLALGCIVPPRRHRPSAFALPPLATAGDAAPVIAAIVSATADGLISPEEAGQLSQIVDTFLRALEAGEIEARLQRLERANGLSV